MGGLGIEKMKGGWSRVLGYLSPEGEWVGGSPICGISARRALWSLYSLCIVVVVVDDWCDSVGIRMSQWSSGELVWVRVGMSGSPTWMRSVWVRKSDKGLWYESWFGEDVACKSPPRRTGVFGLSMVRMMRSH